MTYSYEESKAILRHPAVHTLMDRIVHGREIPAVQTPPWHFDGRDNPTSLFVLFAACVERAVSEAIRVTPPGTSRERLLLLLHITDADDPAATAKAVATAVENYAVEMQFGEAGLRHYRSRGA